MKNLNKIITKYIQFITLLSLFAKARNSSKINNLDLFAAIVYLFSNDVYVKSKLLDYGLDVERLWTILQKEYKNLNLDKNNLVVASFSLTDSLIKTLESSQDLGNDGLTLLYLFFDSISSKEVVDFLLGNDAYDLVFTNFEMIKFLSLAEKNEKLRKKLDKFFTNPNFAQNLVEDEDLERIKAAVDDFSDYDIDLEEEDAKENQNNTQTKTSDKPKLLIDTFATNLTRLAKENKLEPVVGREKEMKEVIYTLLRKTKNNPLLVGEAGVGKTAIVEGLAQQIVKGEVPEKLKNKQIYALDMGSLVAGTKYRGEFEARLKGIIEEAVNPDNNIILFIDEIHTVIGAGNQEGGADTANLLKPYLARGELTVIGATTFDEYRKYIEKDPALTRRFQLIKIEEPSQEDAIKLLEGIKYRFEDYHGVNIDSSAVEKAVKLSKRYILDRFLPDKAIDLIDEAAARKSSKTLSKSVLSQIKKIEEKIEKLESKMQKAVENQDYFTAADYKEEIDNLKREIQKLKNSDTTPKEARPHLTGEDIEKVIAEKYGISSKVLSKSEIEFLSDLENTLNQEILGQEGAVKEVVNAIIRNKLSPIEKNKPIGAFLFLGPSGVGKTYLAQLLAKHFFQDDKALIKINMSEYSQDMSSNKLTGSAPGYVGYEEGGILTEAVRKKPYSVVLFDEIEKGSPQVLNILLQILDQGYLEDNKGRKIDFKNTIVILTSNLGAEYFGKEITKVGFSLGEQVSNQIDDEKKELILNEVKNLFPVELLNRLDKIVFFNPINKDLLEKVFKKYYSEYKKLWKSKKGINVPSLRKEEIKSIIEQIHKEGAGVRGVEKYIYNELENKVIEKLLKQTTKKK